jgi:hypothetical protein
MPIITTVKQIERQANPNKNIIIRIEPMCKMYSIYQSVIR